MILALDDLGMDLVGLAVVAVLSVVAWLAISARDQRRSSAAAETLRFTTTARPAEVAALVGRTLLRGSAPALTNSGELRLNQAAYEGQLSVTAKPHGSGGQVTIVLVAPEADQSTIVRYLAWRQKLQTDLLGHAQPTPRQKP